MFTQTRSGGTSRRIHSASTWRPWLSRLGELLGVVSLIAWSVAVVLVMWSAMAGTPAVALDTVWLLAASALLSAASLLFAMLVGRETVEVAGLALQATTTRVADRALEGTRLAVSDR